MLNNQENAEYEMDKQLEEFYQIIVDDCRIGVSHVAIYIALLYHWSINNHMNPIYIKRKEIMRMTKIKSRHTYYACINDLHNYYYIRYFPSYDPLVGSKVHLIHLS